MPPPLDVEQALQAGKPLPMVLRELRIWGPRERLFERLLPQAHPAAVAQLLQAAHSAVYGAKARGSNAWCFFHENMTQAARERLALEARLRRALELGHMRLYYQPQIELATGRLVGAEALLRWLDPEEGLISPARFIPVAEKSGVIGALGLWVLGEACRQGQQWRAAGLPDLAIAVSQKWILPNVSSYMWPVHLGSQ